MIGWKIVAFRRRRIVAFLNFIFSSWIISYDDGEIYRDDAIRHSKTPQINRWLKRNFIAIFTQPTPNPLTTLLDIERGHGMLGKKSARLLLLRSVCWFRGLDSSGVRRVGGNGSLPHLPRHTGGSKVWHIQFWTQKCCLPHLS